MKNLFFGALAAMFLFAATSVAQQGPKTINANPDGDTVTAVSGDISCVFTFPDTSDFIFVNCFDGTKLAFTETLRPKLGTCNTRNKTGTPVPGEFGPTGDGNFISWSVCQPSPRVFTWAIDDDNLMGNGTFN